MFEEYMTLSVPDITPAAMQKAKDTKFAEWCKDYVSYCFVLLSSTVHLIKFVIYNNVIVLQINDVTQFYTFPM